jgi:ABC-type antimicrobial peptide transport system permease subunit
MRTVLIGLGVGVLKDALLGAAFDPRALVLAPLALAAFLAVALPVFRAASVDPMTVLRDE